MFADRVNANGQRLYLGTVLKVCSLLTTPAPPEISQPCFGGAGVRVSGLTEFLFNFRDCSSVALALVRLSVPPVILDGPVVLPKPFRAMFTMAAPPAPCLGIEAYRPVAAFLGSDPPGYLWRMEKHIHSSNFRQQQQNWPLGILFE